MGIEVSGKRYIPAVKDTKSGQVFPRQFGEEIHLCIHERIARISGIEKLYPDVDSWGVPSYLKNLGFIDGYVEAGTLDFYTRQQMEDMYGHECYGESGRLTSMGICLSMGEQASFSA